VPDSGGSLEVVALDGIPEINAGDDLAAAIGDALARRADLQPLRDDDVLVVTQKVVSKAEGAVVDLSTVEPRPEAVAFAQKFGRDARQVEVVLREARRVVRMDRGVLITETRHGFVCANGGVDASNVGPGSGSIVTLLPADPDASAARIRTAIRGVSGLHPLDDLRGTADHDGRVMQSTVRAVADELASAAELALGKTAGRPVALVRGAAFVRGEGSIRELVMPAENDLFR
jgi:coenzyme F420-0:L-glutamate ligase/coenzyme F420-1:gamma-L-glutamate ligase